MNFTISAFVKHLPSYLSKVDKKGYFRINNVKAGKYRLYALKDLETAKITIWPTNRSLS